MALLQYRVSYIKIFDNTGSDSALSSGPVAGKSQDTPAGQVRQSPPRAEETQPAKISSKTTPRTASVEVKTKSESKEQLTEAETGKHEVAEKYAASKSTVLPEVSVSKVIYSRMHLVSLSTIAAC